MLAAGWTARRRTRRLEAERVRLSRLVEERTVELKHQTEQLAAEQEAKNRFFANVSHELRTPLTLTLGPLEDAASGRQGQLPAGAARSVDMALRNARHLRNLIDQVLDVGRLEAGRMPISAQEGDLGSFVQRIAERFAPAAKRAGKVLDLEGVEGGVEVFFDPTHFERIVSNLLSNAFKFTPPGGRISVRVFRREDPLQIRAVLEVKDSGAGIAAHDLPRVFDRYFQASRTVADQPGTGIGLALVKELVELHGGTVSAESEAGRGATFRLDLRLGRSHFDDEEVEPGLAVTQREDEEAEEAEEADFYVPAETEATEMHQANLESDDTTTLLIVDDNAELRGFLRQRFSALYRILEASEGGAALELCRRRLPDLVIADVMMPGMDGLELTRRLKADRDLEFVPVILLTSRSATEDAVNGLGEGADDYLRKPFESDELQARIDRLISSRRQLRARFAAPEAVTGLNGNDADFDRRLLAAIENQIEAGELSVKSLADSMAMDRTHLYRRVQALRGVTPQDLIRKAKLQTAARMLAGREGTVTEVAYSVGFKSLGHFSDSFRRHFGVPPSRWAEEAAVDTSPPA
jgi:signal transduction histidine kinase/DNA-binding response OmpR family regulator